MGKDFRMVATTFHSLETALESELISIGAREVKKGTRSVSFIGDKGFMYKANIYLRTAIRILKPISKFKVRSEEQLYKQVCKICWNKYMCLDNTFSVKAIVNSPFVSSNSHYIALRIKDAISDYFRAHTNKRPYVDIVHPDLKIHAHLQNDLLSISLDSSGDSLHRRGYRTLTNRAPINEVLAAGVLIISGYRGERAFLDPMCGSGTILIEAAMISKNIPANIKRVKFGFMSWMDYDKNLFNTIYNGLLNRIVRPVFPIVGYDKSPLALIKAKNNIENAGLDNFIEIKCKDFFTCKKINQQDSLTILSNPPYGERLQIDTSSFYSKIGDTLKQYYKNTTAWFIFSKTDGLKNIGLKPSKKIGIKNGKLDCYLVKYDIYQGSKKRIIKKIK